MKIEQQRLNLGSGNFRLSDSPIERVVEDGEDAEKVVRVKLLVVVSHHVEDGEGYVKSVEAVKGNQEVVEANLLLFQEDEYGKGVAADAENSEYEHEETYEEGVVLEDVSRVDSGHVLIGCIASVLVVLNFSYSFFLFVS